LGIVLWGAAARAGTKAELRAAVIAQAMKFVPPERIYPSTNCGMAPMRWDIAFGKLTALGAGAELARQRFG